MGIRDSGLVENGVVQGTGTGSEAADVPVQATGACEHGLGICKALPVGAVWAVSDCHRAACE